MKKVKLENIIQFNPKEILKKGTKCKKISMDKLENFSKYIHSFEYEKYSGGMKFKNGDTLLARITPCLENGKTSKVSILENEEVAFGSTEYIVMRSIEDISDEDFIYYLSISAEFRNIAIQSMTGTSGRQRVQLDVIKNTEMVLPGYDEQVKIGKILSKIDEKMEINNQTNNNLLEISQNLYKRWFIDFEFPKDDGKPYKSSGGTMIESELGMIPENWEIGFIDDGKLTKIIKSGITKFEKNKKYIATADVEGTTIKNFTFVDYDSRPSRANMTPIPNSVWFAKMQDSVKNMIVDSYMTDILDNYIFSTGFMGVECLKNSICYIWNYINSDIFTSLKNNLSTGTLMAGISNTTIVGCKYVIPSETILNLFNNKIQKLNESIYHNEQENKVLKQLKDTLLPKLMNGEIDLENIEI